MLYMVIERFREGDALPVYRRFREQGRLMPELPMTFAAASRTQLYRGATV